MNIWGHVETGSQPGPQGDCKKSREARPETQSGRLRPGIGLVSSVGARTDHPGTGPRRPALPR
jgi:hypothetical protein